MPRLGRRSLLKLATAGAAATAAGASACSSEPPPAPSAAKKAEPMSPRAAAAPDVILSIAPLTLPFRTHEPFVFCVHHDDRYPAGNAALGPAVPLDGRDLGQDFSRKDGFSMYHGRVVPGFPQHPHRGFETVTVVRRGLLDHSDSMGATARYGGGDVQWLTAGRGILHAEMFPLLDETKENPVELFQIWLNLPAKHKMVEPHFSMLWADTIPRRVLRDAQGRTTTLTLIAGRYEGVTPPAPPPHSWASDPDNDVAIWTITLEPGARFVLPAAKSGSHRSLYFVRGAGLRVAGQPTPAYHEVELRADRSVELAADAEPVELLLLQAKPIGEPVVQHGPFVMTSREEIRQAFLDFQRTQFGGWPWASNDPVHPREQGRFARRADGRTERPA